MTNFKPTTWCQRLFAWEMAHLTAEYEAAMADRKRALFADLEGTLLEIGPGAGANLPYYPPHIHWIGMEPNPFMHNYLREKAQALGLQVDLRQGVAEQMEIADRSVDAVVSTLVLCSVKNLEATLQEIRRILKPGGRFFFVEHVAAPSGTWLRTVQRGIRPLWQVLGDGCHPDRETGRALEQAGFAQVEYEQFTGPVPIAIVQPHIMGIATR